MLYRLAKFIAFLNLIRPITAYLINKPNQRDKQIIIAYLADF